MPAKAAPITTGQALTTARLACEAVAADTPPGPARRDLEYTAAALGELKARLERAGLDNAPLVTPGGHALRRRRQARAGQLELEF